MVIRIEREGTPAELRRRNWAANLSATLAAQGVTAKGLHGRLVAEGVDVSKQAVYQWLAGETAPTPERQAAIAKALSVPASVLFPIASAS